MNAPSMIRRFSTSLSVIAMCASVWSCGVAHVYIEQPLMEAQYYSRASIDTVRVQSVERSPKAHQLNEHFGALADRLLQQELSQRYELVGRGAYPDTLAVAVSIQIQYGSRAARYFGGPGAGTGYVDSVLSAVDAVTGDEKLRVSARSELSVGLFGGSMDEAVRKNIFALIRRSGLSR